MNTSSNGYVLTFAMGLCVVISSALALTASALRDKQAAAEEADRQKNVMLAAGLIGLDEPRKQSELDELYRQRVTEHVLELATGEIDKVSVEAWKKMRDSERAPYRLIAITRDAAGKDDTFVVPVSGPGLWSILFGFLALESDGNRVRGITFYKHGETPGLGGECENPVWTSQWVGKRILDDQGQLRSVTVKKNKVDPAIPVEKAHFVDGLSGSTITSNGITNFVKRDLTAYRPFLAKAWARKG
jgi:Na+-transporting NADH:ubiquinone oxidoreductase subunit C